MGFLIDTCIWIDVEQGTLAPADVAAITGNAPVYLSPITIAELRFGVETAPDPGIKQKRKAAFRRLQRKPLLPIDGTTGEIFGDLAAHLRMCQRQPSVPRPGHMACESGNSARLWPGHAQQERLRRYSGA